MDLSSIVQSSAKNYNLDPSLIQAVIQQESGGNPSAMNGNGGGQGAYGAMQVRQGALADYNAANGTKYQMKDLLKPDVGIDVGSWYLGQKLDKFNDPAKALIAYNEGEGSPNISKGTSPYAQSILGKITGKPAALPGIPTPQGNAPQNDEDILASFTKGAKPAQPNNDDAILQSFTKTVAPEKSGTQSQGAVSDFTTAAEHHIENLGAGVSQYFIHKIADWQQTHNPGSPEAGAWKARADTLDSVFQNREKGYQNTVPTNVASTTGAAVGEIAPWLLNGPANLITKGGEIGGKVAAVTGLGKLGAKAAVLSGKAAGSAGLGALSSAVQPVTTPGDFDQQKAQQIETGAAIGGALPVVGATLGKLGGYAANVVSAPFRPFTQGGRQKIAGDMIRQAAEGGPTAVNSAEIVSGSSPTLAEATGNPGIATLQRTIRDLNPNPFVQQEQQNAGARLSALSGATGDASDIAASQAARDTQAQQALGKIFASPNPTDTKPVVDTIQAILDGPSGKRPAVESTLNKLKGLIVDDSGKPTNLDAETLYNSVRKGIGDMIDSKMTTANPAGIQASRELLQVRDALDNQIEQAAPGFKQYLSDYSSSSQPIEAMQHLQGMNLTDANGNITLAKIQSALSGLKKSAAKPGVNAAQSVSQPQIDTLTSIRDDLLRAGNSSLGKSAGSSTAQNFATQQMVRAALPGKLGAFAAHLPSGSISGTLGGLAGYAAGGPTGAAVGMYGGGKVGSLMNTLMNTHNDAIQEELTKMLLNPSVGGTALNSTTSGALPLLPSNTLQRLGYPSAIGISSGSRR